MPLDFLTQEGILYSHVSNDIRKFFQVTIPAFQTLKMYRFLLLQSEKE